MAALFDETSQNPHFFDEGLSKDNLLQSGEKKKWAVRSANSNCSPYKNYSNH